MLESPRDGFVVEDTKQNDTQVENDPQQGFMNLYWRMVYWWRLGLFYETIREPGFSVGEVQGGTAPQLEYIRSDLCYKLC